MTYSIRNWQKFQQYKDHNPRWIKVYRDLLNDPDWFALDGATAKFLMNLWLLASEHGMDGTLPDLRKIAFRLRVSEKEAFASISKLSAWIISNLKEPYGSLGKLTTETETYRKETEKESCSNEFERFWKAYPKRVGKKKAEKALAKALKETSIEAIEQALARQTPSWTDPKFIPHPASWLNAGHWSDEIESATAPSKREFVPGPGLPTDAELRAKYAVERGETETTAAESTGILSEGVSIPGEKPNGLDRDQGRHPGVQKLGDVFSRPRMAAFRDPYDR